MTDPVDKTNFFLNTFTVFKGCKKPKREPDYTSYSYYYGENTVSSQYWYGSDSYGEYVIRYSNHWSERNNAIDCRNVASCIWNLFIPRKSKHIQNGWCCGKAYFKWFKVRK